MSKAVCVLHGEKVSGVITFLPGDGVTQVVGEISGLAPGQHGFHIHPVW